MFKRASYDEMQGMLEQWLETGKVEDSKEVSTADTTAVTTTSSPGASVKDAFEDLFNDN
jgi:hypothetical protein